VPKALQVAGGFVLLLAAVPGLPAAPFLAIGTCLVVGASAQTRARAAADRRADAASPVDRARVGGVRERAFVPVVVPWSLDVSGDLDTVALTPRGMQAMAVDLREQIFADLGVPLPAARVRTRSELDARCVVLSLHEVPAIVLRVPEGVADDDVAAWVRGPVLRQLRTRAADFLGMAEVQRLLDELEPFAAATVRNVVPKPVSLILLTDIMRRLVEEGVSVRDLRGVLEALSSVAATEKDPLALAEYVRGQLRRAITFRLTAGVAQLDVVLVDPILEETVRRAITRTAAGAFLTLAPQAARDVIGALRVAIAAAGTSEAPAVVLTQPDIRRFVRKLIETELPDVWVVSFAELLPEVALKPIARAVPAGM
jgi:type III secretion protein V